MEIKNAQIFTASSRMLIWFFVLTFAITWAAFIPAVTFVSEEAQIFPIIVGAFGPFIASVLVIRVNKGSLGLHEWLSDIFKFKIPLRSYLVGAFVLPIGVGILHFVLYVLLGGISDFDNAVPWWQFPLYLLPTALLSGGNEEPGWRGFALRSLLQWFHPLVASLILGVVHSLWHFPLMDHYETSIGWYMFNLIPLTIIFNWFYLKSENSIFPVMLFHAGTNVIGSFIPTPMEVFDGLGTYMVMRGLVYWIAAVVIVIFTKGSLGYESSTDVLEEGRVSQMPAG